MPFIFSGHMEEITMNRTLPIGNDQFRLVREKNEYYVDKSLFIKEFLEKKDTAALITRPRRFGKTLNMTMLREFLDITRDSRKLFDGLNMDMLMKLMSLFGSMNQQDDNERLLLALKPLLREEKRCKVDTAVKMLKLFALLPILKESGLFGGL